MSFSLSPPHAAAYIINTHFTGLPHHERAYAAHDATRAARQHHAHTPCLFYKTSRAANMPRRPPFCLCATTMFHHCRSLSRRASSRSRVCLPFATTTYVPCHSFVNTRRDVCHTPPRRRRAPSSAPPRHFHVKSFTPIRCQKKERPLSRYAADAATTYCCRPRCVYLTLRIIAACAFSRRLRRDKHVAIRAVAMRAGEPRACR